MQIKIATNVFLLAVIVATVNSAYYPQHCAECEEEVWEEIPCERLSTVSSTTTSTTTPPPTANPVSTTTPKPTVATTTSPAAGAYPTSTKYSNEHSTPAVYAATTAKPFKTCYCECKVGCKDFCRKVIVATNPKSQITQYSTTAQQIPYGRVETKHLHERTLIPDYHRSSDNSYPTVYNKPPSASYPLESIPSGISAHTYPSGNNINSYGDGLIDTDGYSVDELTRLVQPENINKGDYRNPSAIHYSQIDIPGYAHGTAPTANTPPLIQSPQLYTATYNKPNNFKVAAAAQAAVGKQQADISLYSNYASQYKSPEAVHYDTVKSVPYSHQYRASSIGDNAAINLALNSYLKDYSYASPVRPSSYASNYL